MERISNFVDGVSDGAIYGWIANLDRPDTLEQVVVHGDGTYRTVFKACHPRRDVCDALAVPGRFGFEIPASALQGIGPVRCLTDANGALLKHSKPIDPRERSTAPRPNDPAWAVIHIPKTAGTSLRTALAGIVRRGETVFLYQDGHTGISPAELFALPARQRGAIRLAIGHVFRDVFRALPRRLEYITVLREAGARLRSQFYHNIVATRADTTGGLPALVARINEGLTADFDNLMVRMVAGLPEHLVPPGQVNEVHVTAALHTIRTEFRFVATAEALETQFPALCHALGVHERLLTRENLQRLPSSPGLEHGVDWDRALHNNRFDAMLYDRAIAEGLVGRDLMPPSHRKPLEALPPR